MRSRASFRGHPLHPALIPFPFAFLVGAFVFDLAGYLLERPGLWITGWYLAPAGVGMALVAAVPGAIDYFTTVPPRSSGRRRATKHAAVNLLAVALFAVAWFVRGHPEVPSEPGTLVVQGVAAALLTLGGWMGGTLVFRNQIGVDHRYANAGKWQVDTVRRERLQDDETDVGPADELGPDQMKLLRVGERRIVIGRTDQGFVAFDDRCTHRGGPLADGVLACGVVQCPWHGSQFDVQTGAVKRGPAGEGIRTYDVRERDGRLWLRVPAAPLEHAETR
jgi:nitrite reductase/ring-hydroxylating ferredoxin subunit/uncharacterized membrane protein